MENRWGGSLETTRVDPFAFNQWLAGFIEGDGSWLINRSGYTSCEITVSSKEMPVLFKIKSSIGGSVHKRSSVEAWRWRLHNQKGMELLVETVNGYIQAPLQYQRFSAVCNLLERKPYQIPLEKAVGLNSSWLVGFFDAEGAIRINPLTGQPSVAIGQKNDYLLSQICRVWKGRVYKDLSWNGFVWVLGGRTPLIEFCRYLSSHRLQIPVKQAKLITFQRYLLYLQRKDPADREKIQELIKRFNIDKKE